MSRFRSVLALACLAALTVALGSVSGDEIQVGRTRIRGAVVKTEGGQTVINTYNSTNPRMTRGAATHDAGKVRVLPEKDPVRAYLEEVVRRSPPGSEAAADIEFTLGVFAEERKLSEAAREHFLRALLAEPHHAGALSRFKDAELERVKAADPRFNRALADELETWFGLESLRERKAKLGRFRVDHGFDPGLVFMERVRRSRPRPKGRHDDVPLSFRSADVKGVYTLYVPKSYDPMRPTPLVIGLHGGGRDGKDGKDVVGSGRSAMNFYERGAERFGYLVACPSAVRAPWADPMNDDLLNAVLDEVRLLYNVDLNRVYLTGHSMGGFGTWHFGPRYAHRWAVIAPMAGGGSNGFGKLEKTRTPVYLYHGADDAVVGVGDSRRAGDTLQKMKHDFIYTEIPDSGHGFPPDVAEEMWSFFHVHRLAVTAKRSEKGKFTESTTPYSSFSEPVSKLERLYFGAPGEDPAQDKKTLLARLKLGGGAAREAADGLIALADKTTVTPVGALVVSSKKSEDVRREAARVLGGLGLAEGAKPLFKALKRAPVDLLPDFARAVASLGAPKSVAPLTKAMKRLHGEFEGRLTRKTHMAFSDWDRCLAGYGALAAALGTFEDPAALPALDSALEKVLLPRWDVRKSDRAGLDPDVPLGRCVADFVRAYGRIGGETASRSLERIESRHGSLRDVREALTAVREGTKQGG